MAHPDSWPQKAFIPHEGDMPVQTIDGGLVEGASNSKERFDGFREERNELLAKSPRLPRGVLLGSVSAYVSNGQGGKMLASEILNEDREK